MSFTCACGKSFKHQQSLSNHGLGKLTKKGPCPAYMDRKNSCLSVNVNSNKEHQQGKSEKEKIDVNKALREKNDQLVKNIRATIKILDNKKTEFFYLLIEREFLKTQEPIYKVGRTTVIQRRFMRYPKGSEIILVLKVPNCEEFETSVKKKFKNQFINRLDIGEEYFEGSVREMKNIIYDLEMSFTDKFFF